MDLNYGDMKKAFAGLKHGLQDETKTFMAGEKLSPGDPVFSLVGDDNVGYKAHVNGVKLTTSAALVIGTSVGVTINGITLDSVAFETSMKNTLQNIVNTVNLDERIRALNISAFLLEGDDLSIYLGGPGITITASAVVTGGAQTFTASASTSARFVGVVRHMGTSYKDGAGFWPAKTAVGVMTNGEIFVPVADDAAPDNLKPVYVILSGGNAGLFTDEATGNYDCGCIFRSDRVEGNLALIEVRGIK